MLDFLLEVLAGNEGIANAGGDREVTQIVCPLVAESASLRDFYELLLPDEETADRLTYHEDERYQIVAVETYGRFPMSFPVTNQLRIFISKADDSCGAVVFHLTL